MASLEVIETIIKIHDLEPHSEIRSLIHVFREHQSNRSTNRVIVVIALIIQDQALIHVMRQLIIVSGIRGKRLWQNT